MIKKNTPSDFRLGTSAHFCVILAATLIFRGAGSVDSRSRRPIDHVFDHHIIIIKIIILTLIMHYLNMKIIEDNGKLDLIFRIILNKKDLISNFQYKKLGRLVGRQFSCLFLDPLKKKCHDVLQ